MANRIKELRMEKELNQTELGNLLNVSQRSISFYESGERDPDTETLKKLSEIFNCSIDYLLCKTNKRKWDTETIAFSTVSVDGLDDEEIAQIRGMIELLKKKHGK